MCRPFESGRGRQLFQRVSKNRLTSFFWGVHIVCMNPFSSPEMDQKYLTCLPSIRHSIATAKSFFRYNTCSTNQNPP